MSTAQTTVIQSPHRLVRASAGSGKTFQLTNTYLRLLIEGENPAELFATTFTRAAAGEILHRALARLSNAVVDDDALKELQTHVDHNLTHVKCAETLERIVGVMHRLSVMTIDAFFARLATSFSLELGLAPGWRMLDEDEDKTIRAVAVSRTLQDAPQREVLEILHDLSGDDIRMHAHQAMMDVVNEGYAAYLATLGDTSPWSAIRPKGTALNSEALECAREALGAVDLPMTKAGRPDMRWKKALESALRAVIAEDWEGFLISGFGKIALAAEVNNKTVTYYKKELPSELTDILTRMIGHARLKLTTEHVRRTAATLQLLERFDGVYTNMKRSLGVITYDDPPRLLLNAQTTGNFEHLYFRLDARIRHVLLDEFQDTSMMQFRLLEPILDEMLSQAEGGRSVFCVGDAKQSLYAWRQAEPTLLPALARRWPTLREETLSTSWRSSSAVLDAVNAIFTDMQSNDALRPSSAAMHAVMEWDERFGEHVAGRKNMPGAARLSVADDREDGEESCNDENQSVLQSCVDRVADARGRAPKATIAVLVRRGADLRTILSMLKHRGIDASEQRGNPLADAPSVAAAVSMLSLIEHPGHSAALYHVANSPLGRALGLIDPHDDDAARRVTAKLRRKIAITGCADVLSDWLEVCADSMDARGVARFEQFIDAAEAFDIAATGGPAQLAKIAETRRVDEPGRAPVRVMTIHGAKGLEFDVVVVPLVSSKPWQVSSRSVIMGRDEPLGAVKRVSRYPNEMMRMLHPELEALHLQAMQKQVNEEICCLYVALTRAKYCLEMVVPADTAGRKGDPLACDAWKLKPAHVVRAALAPDSPAAPGELLWSKQTVAKWFDDEHLQCPNEPETPPEYVSLRTRAPEHRSAAHLASASPSQTSSGKAIAAASILLPTDRNARALGDLVHLWFEQIEWLDAGAPDDAVLLEIAMLKGIDDGLIHEALPAFRRAIESEPIRTALCESAWQSRMPNATEVRVYRERPFAVRDADARGDRLLQGRFDRLVVGRTDGRIVCAEVFDFKTDRGATNCTGDALVEFAEHHHPQMEAYRRAAARLLRLTESHIATTLVFTAAGETVTLMPALG